MLAVNQGRCPLSELARQFTVDQAGNFDIYPANWLAWHNKGVFGLLFIAGELVVFRYWFGQGHAIDRPTRLRSDGDHPRL